MAKERHLTPAQLRARITEAAESLRYATPAELYKLAATAVLTRAVDTDGVPVEESQRYVVAEFNHTDPGRPNITSMPDDLALFLRGKPYEEHGPFECDAITQEYTPRSRPVLRVVRSAKRYNTDDR